MFPSRSSSIVWVAATLFSLSSAAILAPSRSLMRKPKPQVKIEMPAADQKKPDEEPLRKHFRQIALDNFVQCFNPGAIGETEWAEFQTGCFYTYFKNKATGDEHIKLSEKGCASKTLFDFLQSNKLFSEACFNFVKAIRNYGIYLISVTKSWGLMDKFEDNYKKFYFSWADQTGENKKLTSKDDLPELISKTVVSIYKSDQILKEGQLILGEGSGNLVDFDPATKKVKNICGDGAQTATLNFLLTAAHCMKELDEKLVQAKVKAQEIHMKLPLVLASIEIFIEANIGRNNLRAELMKTPTENKWDSYGFKESVPVIEAGKKIVGEDVFIDLFQDKDTILVKLAKPVEIACPAGKSIDFGHANPNQAIREKMVEAVQKQETSMGLYGFNGGFNPMRIKMHPVIYDAQFLAIKKESEQNNSKENQDSKVRNFILNGAALNGAIGGPLFLEDGGKVAFIGTVIRGEVSTAQGWSAVFNVRNS